jgi:serine phosphatase RsbU (regulator of sigma subunit)
MNKILLLLSILTLFYNIILAQKQGQARIDSLLTELTKAKDDTNKVNLLNELSVCFYNIAPDKGIKFGLSGKELAEKLNYKIGIAKTEYSLGFNYYRKSDYPTSLDYYFKALHLISDENNRTLEEKHLVAKLFGNIGSVYRNLNDSLKTFEYYNKGLKMEKALGDKLGTAEILQKIGNAYYTQGEDSLALVSYKNALRMFEELGDKSGICRTLGNMAGIYSNKGNFQKALEYNLKSFTIAKEIGLKNVEATGLGNFGLSYFDIVKDTIGKNINDSLKNKKVLLIKAEDYVKKAIIEFKKLQNLISLQDYYLSLSEIQKYSGNYLSALESFNQSVIYGDSVYSQKNQTKIAEIENQLKEDVKQKEIEIQQLQIASAKKERWYFIFGLSSLLLMLIFAYNRYKVAQKQNKVIAEQKEVVEYKSKIVEEKQREILDSIEYALRIQTAILPPQKIVKQYLEYSFILYKPKDIVAGDFYWMETIDDVILFAACDCTGHGVPGAMVSVVCHNALTRTVKEFGLIQPAKILDKTAEIVLENFSKSEEEIHDGMDISICSYNTKTKTLEWAGANNSLLLITNGQLAEIKADKKCIGYNDNVKPFTNHQFNILTDTSIYLFTDGFADQFGGQPVRKLTKSKFKDLLVSIQHLPIQQQGRLLDEFITNYKKETEQTDDILVIGVKV